MPRLKNNVFTQDVRLDRIAQFDDRSRNHPIRGVVELKPLVSKAWTLRKYLDQGQEGACVGFGYSAELAAQPEPVSGVTNQTARNLYWQAQKLDDMPGGSYPGNTDEVYEGTSVLAGAKAAVVDGYYTGYKWAFSEEDIALAISQLGPVVIGVNWYEGMYDPDSDGYLQVSGQVVGGHCTLLKGINVEQDYYVLHNSWGKSWGLKGTAKLSRASMTTLLAQDGEACLPVRGTKLNV
jgi:papain like protease